MASPAISSSSLPERPILVFSYGFTGTGALLVLRSKSRQVACPGGRGGTPGGPGRSLTSLSLEVTVQLPLRLCGKGFLGWPSTPWVGAWVSWSQSVWI